MSQFVYTPKTSGYTIDDREYLADLSSACPKAAPQEVTQTKEVMDGVLDSITKEEGDILAYVAGFLLLTVLKSAN